MMRIRVETIPDAGLSLVFDENAEAFPVINEMVQAGECEFVAPISLRLKVVRVRDMIEVEGQLHTIVRLACNRCLAICETPLENRFALTYVQEIPESRGKHGKEEIEIGEDDVGLIHFSGDHIDLRDGIQEQIVLAFPMRFQCSDQCRGLCPRCGADLNKGDCGCGPVSSGGGFEILKGLKIDEPAKSQK